MDAQSIITEAVKAAMTVRGVNRADLAKALGRDKSWVSHKLNGRRGWQVDDLDSLVEVFGMPPAAFLIRPAADELRARRDSNPQPSDPKVVPPAVKRLVRPSGLLTAA